MQYGWQEITEALKFGGITLMMSCLDNAARVRANALAEQTKQLLTPLFAKHQDDILSGAFSAQMMADWDNDDHDLLRWREQTRQTAFEQAPSLDGQWSSNRYFERGIVMVALVKAGVELAFETMVSAGIRAESAYYESLHELPLIANTIARKRLYEMNVVISDTAEYGNYLFANAAHDLLQQGLFGDLGTDVIGKGLVSDTNSVNYASVNQVNDAIYQHPVEQIGRELRDYMKEMKPIGKKR